MFWVYVVGLLAQMLCFSGGQYNVFQFVLLLSIVVRLIGGLDRFEQVIDGTW